MELPTEYGTLEVDDENIYASRSEYQFLRNSM